MIIKTELGEIELKDVSTDVGTGRKYVRIILHPEQGVRTTNEIKVFDMVKEKEEINE